MKKLIKKIFVLLMVFIFCFLPFVNATALTYDDFEYILINDTTQAEITLYKGSSSSVKIPSSINGYPVTSIGDGCFRGRSDITNILIPASVTNFGDYAFAGTAWLENEPDDYVVYNGVLIKYKGEAKDTVLVPSEVSVIGYGAFDFGKFEEVIIHDGVTDILQSAFYGCSNLKWVNIPASVKRIDNLTFTGCGSLETISVDENNKNYASVGGVLFSNDMTSLIMCPEGKMFSYEVPDSVTFLEDWAFANCANLSEIVLPDGVTVISDSAFYGCNSLQTIRFGNNITKIGKWAFAYCTALPNMSIPTSVQEIGYGAFISCPSLLRVSVSSNVSEIGECAFGYTLEKGEATAKLLPGFTIHIDNPEDVKYTDTVICDYVKKNSISFTVQNEFEHMMGDVDGDEKITATDARMALRASAMLITLSPVQFNAADVDGNGKVTASDARRILRVSSKLESFD